MATYRSCSTRYTSSSTSPSSDTLKRDYRLVTLVVDVEITSRFTKVVVLGLFSNGIGERRLEKRKRYTDISWSTCRIGYDVRFQGSHPDSEAHGASCATTFKIVGFTSTKAPCSSNEIGCLGRRACGVHSSFRLACIGDVQ